MSGAGGRIVIRGGSVVDGTGSPARRADVAVEAGRVVEIADRLTGDEQLDASGMAVTPGFIDLHTHYDAQVFWDWRLSPSCWHGVTTVVIGNCGFSIAPCRPGDNRVIARTLERVEDMPYQALMGGVPWDFESYPEYLDSVRRHGTLLNVGGYIGHTALRLYVLGADAGYSRAATDEELATMRRLVAGAVAAGALGFSTSAARNHFGDAGRPVPSRLAGLAELSELTMGLQDAGRGIAALLPGDRISHQDIYDLQPRVGRPFTWTALVGRRDGAHRRIVALHDAAIAAGADVHPQVSVRPISFQITMEDPYILQTISPFAALMGSTREERIARYRDPDWRRNAEAAVAAEWLANHRWEAISIAETGSAPELVGRDVAGIAAEHGRSPLEVILDLALAEDLRTRFTVVSANDDEAAIAGFLDRDDLILGLSDAGAHVSQICDACFTTDLLGRWVRERGALSLESAVHKLTARPAQLLGLAERGTLRPGQAADICVFDPATVAPGPLRRVLDVPGGGSRLVADRPAGVSHVLVNGDIIRRDGRPLEAGLARRPGQVLSATA